MTANSNASYTYDSNGNTTSKAVGSDTTTYAWDYENRLTGVTLPGSSGSVTFKYDPFGRRIEKISPTTTSIFAYDGDNLIETVNSTGSTVARYTQGQNIDEPLAESRSGTTSYYEQDGLGSVTSLSSSTGTLAQTYSYDSFGNTTNSTGSLTNFFRYTAREFDTETNLYFNRARYLNPAVGRFLSGNPLKFGGGDINLFRYVWNSATNVADPLGFWGAGVTAGGGAGGGLGMGAGVGGSVGGIVFANPSAPGGFTSGGYLSTHAYGSCYGVWGNNQNNKTTGLYDGVGAGFVLTNARSIEQVAGPFYTTEINLWVGQIDVGFGTNGVWTVEVTAGPGAGLGVSDFISNTWTSPPNDLEPPLTPSTGNAASPCSCSN